MAKASNFKTWCTENISPQCWTRICLKCADIIRQKGITLSEMEDLNAEIELDDRLLEALNDALYRYYEVKVDEGSLAAIQVS
ncbi:MAG: hypothetical protein OXH57_12135 [Ekhidna sp.]|nr:hypothetical protein [Ekhidna sp.]